MLLIIFCKSKSTMYLVNLFEFIIRYYSLNNIETIYWKRNKEISDKFKLKANAWKKNCVKINNIVYVFLKKKNFFSQFTINILKEAKKLLNQYNLLISEICTFLKRIDSTQKIIQKSLPHLIQKLQCIFIESPVFSLYSVLFVKSNKSFINFGLGKWSFLNFEAKKYTLKKLKYKSACYVYFKKCFAKFWSFEKELIKLKHKIKSHNHKLIIELVKNTLIKTIQKNYKSGVVLRLWISKQNSDKYQSLSISNLKDCILQKIIELSVVAIIEFQSNVNSFVICWKNQNAIKAIKYVSKSLFINQKHLKKKKLFPLKAFCEIYKNWKERKFCKQKSKQIALKKLTPLQHKYLNQYWILKHLRKKNEKLTAKLTFKFHKYFRILNLNIEQCFDQINRCAILELIPLTDKYIYFIKQWLVAKTIILNKHNNIGDIVIQSSRRIFHLNSSIRSLCCSLIFESMQKLLDNYKKLYLQCYNSRSIVFFKKKSLIYNTKIKSKLGLIQSHDNFLIYGTLTKKQFNGIIKLFSKFLFTRGLNIKLKTNKSFLFKPGTFFEFLGYKFIFSNRFNVCQINSGRYTRVQPTFLRIVNNAFSYVTRFKIFLIISPVSYKSIVKSIKKCLHSKNFNKTVCQMIKKLNEIIQNTVNYYGYTALARLQLYTLDYSIRWWFWKYLKKKYQSKFKIKTFLRKNFISKNNKFNSGNFTLLEFSNLYPKNKQNFIVIFFNKKFQTKNIYINKKYFFFHMLKKYNLDNIHLALHLKKISEIPLQIKLLIWKSQKYKCTICYTFIQFDQKVRVIHNNPSVINLKQLLFFQIIKNRLKNNFLNFKITSMQIKNMINLFKMQQKFIWEQVFSSKIQPYLTHKTCNVLRNRLFVKKNTYFFKRLFVKFSNTLYLLYKMCSDFVRVKCNILDKQKWEFFDFDK